MTDEGKAARAIEAIKDKEGVVQALVVTAPPLDHQGGTSRVVYRRHQRFEALLLEKEEQDDTGVGDAT